jgi:hypothetical protein
MRHFWLILLGTLALTPTTYARDLQGRLGLGYNNQWANQSQTGGVPAVSLKYAFTRDIATELVVGVATSTPGNSVFGVKFFKNIFLETNLNFYFVAGLGRIAANSKSGTQLLSGFGSEFFIPGIESLGFSMEMGGELENLSGSFVLKTMGISFLNAGMHFYF